MLAVKTEPPSRNILYEDRTEHRLPTETCPGDDCDCFKFIPPREILPPCFTFPGRDRLQRVTDVTFLAAAGT